jgi:hypothetical protein
MQPKIWMTRKQRNWLTDDRKSARINESVILIAQHVSLKYSVADRVGHKREKKISYKTSILDLFCFEGLQLWTRREMHANIESIEYTKFVIIREIPKKK